MHALKFIEASGIDGIQLVEGPTLHSPVCRTCLVSFRENVRAILGLSSVPGWASLATMQWAEAGTRAAQRAVNSTCEEDILNADQIKLRNLIQFTHEEMAKIVDRDMPSLHKKLEVCTRSLDDIAMKSGPYIHSMFHTLLKTICVQSWGALEVLCETLLTGAVDTHSTAFEHIQGRKLYFRKLDDGIRKWYHRAFQNDEIDSILSNGSLSGLAQVRHVIVHSAGVVDDFFKQAVSTTPSLHEFAHYKVGDPILFDGEIVRTLIEPAITKGYDLLTAVDRWLLSKHLSRLPKL